MQLSKERLAPIIISTNIRFEPVKSTVQDNRVRKWLDNHNFDPKKDSLSKLYYEASQF